MHDNAAGISILDKNLSELHTRANKDLAQFDFGENCYDVNFIRNVNDKDIISLIKDICSADGIWGQANSQPIIYVTGIRFSKDEIQIMGKNQDTVKIEKNGIAFMKFFAKELIKELEDAPNDLVMNVIGRANLNEWGGRVTPQIFIDDYEILDEKLQF